MSDLDHEKSDGASFSVENTRGAVVKTMHTNREVKIYGLLETEIDALANLGREQRLWTTISATSLTLGIGCFWDMANVEETAKIRNESYLFVTCCFVVCGLSFLKAYSYSAKQKNVLEALNPDARPGFWSQLGDRILSYLPKK